MEFKIGDKVKCASGVCKGIEGNISKIEEDAIWCKKCKSRLHCLTN